MIMPDSKDGSQSIEIMFAEFIVYSYLVNAQFTAFFSFWHSVLFIVRL